MATYQQCECNFCGTTLRFEISQRNQLVNCQDCGMETVISVPGAELPYPPEEFFLQATNVGWSKHPLGFRNVVGAVVNNSTKDFDWVRIEFTLVNREAMPIGSTSDCIIHFPVNSVWSFQAPVFQLDAVGVGAPLLSCEYGKISVPQRIVHPAAVSAGIPPAPAPQHSPPQHLEVQPVQAAKGPSQWSGLRITGGVTGVAHRQ